jgi:acetyltransferase-like isoleucine patch superfamily enzyme
MPRMIWGYTDSSREWRPRTRISDTVSFYRRENIYVADNVFIGHFCILDGTERLEINEGVQLAGWNGLYTHSSHIAIRLYGAHYAEIPEKQKKGYRIGRVRLGRYAFVGAGAKIFPGVEAGHGCLIAANSVVTRNVEPFEIVAGNPVVSLGDTRKLDAQYLLDPQLLQWYQEWQQRETAWQFG